ncbi:MAG: alanine--tRNA ligase [Candidatus Kerfeldbacteria bacterium]|nr:alanine--tRNA ligase [Candidatus Kerfeldbacteria bacterium]
MKSHAIKKKFIRFFEEQEHRIVQSSSLWPQDDPSVLLTTAGMQPFKPYFMGEKDPNADFGACRLASIQRCFRTSDIESVGDATHSTFFEMLGNFSINDYFKEEAIRFAWEFLVDELKLDKKRIWITYFKGDADVPADLESKKIWKQYVDESRIVGFERADNWWGPPGKSGPCGPSSEIHYDMADVPVTDALYGPNAANGSCIEIWNLVFTEYHMNEQGVIKKLKTKSIDTGMGFERLAMIMQRVRAVSDIDVNHSLVELVRSDPMFGSTTDIEDIWRSRIVADHIKGTVFLLADGISFSNKEQGYILRRIFRRALDQYLHQPTHLEKLVSQVIKNYYEDYPHLKNNEQQILAALAQERAAYEKVLKLDVSELVQKLKGIPYRDQEESQSFSHVPLSAQEAFTLFSTYGLSLDRLKRKGYQFDEVEFNKLVAVHQEKSRAASQSKFGGHGINSSELTPEQKVEMTKLHTATHLLHQALRTVLGPHVRQQGSDINAERLRFDFEHPTKMTPDELKRVEDLVNEQIQANLSVEKKEMSYDEAIRAGALAFFKEKYGNMVTVYSIGNFSKELCGGPHVSNTGELGIFKIVSEKSSSAGIRRIKATVGGKG